MKVVLSRKGFDSTYGGYASPIFPNGRMISLPVPSMYDKIMYSQLHFDGDITYYSLMKDLNDKIHVKENSKSEWKPLIYEIRCHLDPDINLHILEREKDWMPIFGQKNTAAWHLLKKNVHEGDLFLFFGWFKEAEKIDGEYRYKINAKDLHVIFGYLQIGQIIKTAELEKIPHYLRNHAHTHEKRINEESNTMFVARERLAWNENISGAGIFNFDESLILTKDGMSRTQWKLPDFFRNLEISYHPKKSKKYGWKEDYFQSATRGQEFVIEENTQVEEWAKNLINKNTKN